jgi:hypothetical protein
MNRTYGLSMARPSRLIRSPRSRTAARVSRPSRRLAASRSGRRPFVLRTDLPGLIRTLTPAPLPRRTTKRSLTTTTPQPFGRNPAKITRSQTNMPTLHDRREFVIQKITRNCKARPDSRMARRGSGGSRPFIPWCR